jgi:hypothetical protein
MERLVEKRQPDDAAEAHLVDLLRASAPFSASVARKQQVLMRVLERRRTSRRGAGKAWLFLRPAIIVAVLLAAGVTVAGTVGQSLLTRGLRLLSASGDEPGRPAPLRRPSKREHLAPIGQSDEVEIHQPSASLQARPGPRVGDRLRPSKGEDPSRVVGAVKALRTENDPARAARLLAEYLRIYPRGALLEEALALSIEAAAARRDPAATTFAARYLAEFPKGRFRRAAEQALSQRTQEIGAP